MESMNYFYKRNIKNMIMSAINDYRALNNTKHLDIGLKFISPYAEAILTELVIESLNAALPFHGGHAATTEHTDKAKALLLDFYNFAKYNDMTFTNPNKLDSLVFLLLDIQPVDKDYKFREKYISQKFIEISNHSYFLEPFDFTKSDKNIIRLALEPEYLPNLVGILIDSINRSIEECRKVELDFVYYESFSVRYLYTEFHAITSSVINESAKYLIGLKVKLADQNYSMDTIYETILQLITYDEPICSSTSIVESAILHKLRRVILTVLFEELTIHTIKYNYDCAATRTYIRRPAYFNLQSLLFGFMLNDILFTHNKLKEVKDINKWMTKGAEYYVY